MGNDSTRSEDTLVRLRVFRCFPSLEDEEDDEANYEVPSRSWRGESWHAELRPSSLSTTSGARVANTIDNLRRLFSP